jgi:hypothetical protein
MEPIVGSTIYFDNNPIFIYEVEKISNDKVIQLKCIKTNQKFSNTSGYTGFKIIEPEIKTHEVW